MVDVTKKDKNLYYIFTILDHKKNHDLYNLQVPKSTHIVLIKTEIS